MRVKRRWREGRAWSAGFALLAGLGACSPGSPADPPMTVVTGFEDPSTTGGTGGTAPTVLPPDSREQMLYELPPPPGCGDFEQGTDETCDDGNRENGDGCSANCLVVENGYACPEAGKPCVLAEICGDARRVLSETCDDGNAEGGDGCSASCLVENGYVCPTPGAPCERSDVCGDGFVGVLETCDDLNVAAGDGCSDACALEVGFACDTPGAPCRPICGDGLQLGFEQCDTGDAPTEGCTDCRLVPGFACDVPGEACRATICRDGVAEGSEQCDDGNAVPYDGCTAECVNEPRCGYVGGVYTCQAVCGDGMKFPEEACDDGNTRPDDGCSPTCEREPGYSCSDDVADQGDVLALPIIYRDFENTHPQFEIDPLTSPRLTGIVQEALGENGKPVYDPDFTFQGKPWTMDGPPKGPASPLASTAGTLDAAEIAAAFAEWYTDVPGVNQRIVDALSLELQADGSFVFSATGAGNQFFPIDGQGFGNQGADITGVAHNFHFTSEVRQWFLAQGGEQLIFTGDDDVWVFVNGQLTVDLGGIHGEIRGSILLSETGAGSELCHQDNVGLASVCTPIDVPISPNVNEIVVFQAERHVTASNYTLTLRGFNAPVTTCQSQCGDGIVTPDEACDDGEANGSGYNFCNADCTPGPRCGDGVSNGDEECDNGVNRDGYSLAPESCAPGCVRPRACGDGVIDGDFGEQCDDGVDGNDGSYGGCSPACLLGPRCGDGEVNGAEQCDDGNRRNTDGCNVNCFVEREPA